MKRPTSHARRCPECGQRVGLSLTVDDVRAIWRIKAGRNWNSTR
jgi:hypothetical protein